MFNMQKQPVKTGVVTFGKRSYILPYISIILFGLMACNSGPGTEKQKSPGADTNTVINKTDLTKIKVGYCTPSLNAPFYVVLSQYIQKYAEGYGMKFVSSDGQDDIIKQITSIEDLIAAGVKVLIVNPLDHKALVPAVNAVVKSGVPVFIVDSYIDPAANYITSVMANNQGNGELIGEWIVN